MFPLGSRISKGTEDENLEVISLQAFVKTQRDEITGGISMEIDQGQNP